MDPYLAQLTAIRAFFSVVRHGGVASAARVLNVTPGAVRHHIRKLEEDLGAQLLVRSRRELQLTPAGSSLYAKISPAFEEIQSACRTAAAERLEGELRVACSPGLAALRMARVLDRFCERFPLVTVRLLPIEESSEAMDVIVSYGERPIKGARHAILRDERYFAVCSPELSYRSALRVPEDIANHVMLHSDTGEDWQRLLGTAKHGTLAPRQHVYFPNTYLALQAALDGCGVAVGSSILCSDALRRGALVKVLDLEIPAPHPYFVILPGEEARSLAKEFCAILLDSLDQRS